jgi:hypothetical protein
MSLSITSSKTLQGISSTVSATDGYIYVNSSTKNIFFGVEAGASAKTGNPGSCNMFMGFKAGFANTSGFGNLFIGKDVGIANTMGSENVFIGNNTGLANISSSRNTVIGTSAGTNLRQHSNVIIGAYNDTLYANTDRTEGNTSIGTATTFSGKSNIIIGSKNTNDANNSILIGNNIFNEGKNSVIMNSTPVTNRTDNYVNIADIIVKEVGIARFGGPINKVSVSDCNISIQSDTAVIDLNKQNLQIKSALQSIVFSSNATTICSEPEICIRSKEIVKIGDTVYIPGDLVVTGNVLFKNINLLPDLNNSNFRSVLENVRDKWGKVEELLNCCSNGSSPLPSYASPNFFYDYLSNNLPWLINPNYNLNAPFNFEAANSWLITKLADGTIPKTSDITNVIQTLYSSTAFEDLVTKLSSSNSSGFDTAAADTWMVGKGLLSSNQISTLVINTLNSNSKFNSNAADTWLSQKNVLSSNQIVTLIQSNTTKIFESNNSADVWLSQKNVLSSNQIVTLIQSNTTKIFESNNSADVWLSQKNVLSSNQIVTLIQSNTTKIFESNNSADVWLSQKNVLSSNQIVTLIQSNTTKIFESNNSADVWLSQKNVLSSNQIVTLIQSNSTKIFESNNSADVWLSQKNVISSNQIVTLIQSNTSKIFESNNSADVWLSQKNVLSSNQIVTLIQSNSSKIFESNNSADIWLSQKNVLSSNQIVTLIQSNTSKIFDSNSADVWLSQKNVLSSNQIVTLIQSNTSKIFDSNSADIWLSQKNVLSSNQIVTLIQSNTSKIFDSNSADIWLTQKNVLSSNQIVTLIQSNTSKIFDSNSADIWLSTKSNILSSSQVATLLQSNTSAFETQLFTSNNVRLEALMIRAIDSNIRFDSNQANIWLSTQGVLTSNEIISRIQSNNTQLEQYLINVIGSNVVRFDSNLADAWLSNKGVLSANEIVTLIKSNNPPFDSNSADVWLTSSNNTELARLMVNAIDSNVRFDSNAADTWLTHKGIESNQIVSIIEYALSNHVDAFGSNGASNWFHNSVNDGEIELFDDLAATSWFVDNVVEGNFVLFDEAAAHTWFIDNVTSGYYVLFDEDAATAWFIDQVYRRNFILFDEIAANEWHTRLIEEGHIVLFDCNAANDWLHSNLDTKKLVLFDSNAADDWFFSRIESRTVVMFDSNATNDWFATKLIYTASGVCEMHNDITNVIDGSTFIDGDLIVRGKVCALSFPVVFDSNAAANWFECNVSSGAYVLFDSNAASTWFEGNIDSGTYVLFDSNAANVWWKDKLLLNGMCSFDSNHDPDNEIVGTTFIDGDLFVRGKLCVESIPVLFDSNAATQWFGDLLSNSIIVTQPSHMCSNFSPNNIFEGDAEIVGNLRVTGKICGDLMIYAPPIFENVSMKSISVDEMWNFTIESNTGNLLIGKNSNTSISVSESGTDITGTLSIDKYWKQYLDVESNLVFESRNGVLIEFNEMWKADVLNFTGKHRCYSDIKHPRIGQLVYAKGTYMNLDDGATITIDEALPIVAITRKAFDARVLGVVGGVDTVGEYQIGHIKFSKQLRSKRLIVQSHGEGAILVCNINGNFKNGNFITSSSVIGHGMRQISKLRYNHTIAKITCDCNFTGRNVYEVIHKGKKYRACLVGCFYV